MNRITILNVELTEINGRIWIFDRAEGVGRFATMEDAAAKVGGLLNEKSPVAAGLGNTNS